MSVILYTKPNCVQCSATERALQQQKIPFTAVDLTQDTQALAKIVSMGYRQVPVCR
ncbi:glutaredoxin-like protein [Proteus mirabilis]|uniref:Glutaredoxin-like protein n=1 Tax=Proteus mirabilis TaxID=584 RepID=A0A2X2BTW2_PROMI|nr:glutaredoxin-like protein [Proteus mirabilis]